MYRAVIIDPQQSFATGLLQKIKVFCPSLIVSGIAKSDEDNQRLLQEIDNEIVFINPACLARQNQAVLQSFIGQKAFICVAPTTDYAQWATSWRCIAYLQLPIQIQALVKSFDSAKDFIHHKKELHQREVNLRQALQPLKEKKLVGIPCIDGFDILRIKEIIRCEGLQKYTRIVTQQKSNIVSSYNIGAFKKILAPSPLFFSPHRSHIINLLCVEKFKKSGTIILRDGSKVPIAKKKKEDFLNRITQL